MKYWNKYRFDSEERTDGYADKREKGLLRQRTVEMSEECQPPSPPFFQLRKLHREVLTVPFSCSNAVLTVSKSVLTPSTPFNLPLYSLTLSIIPN